MPARGNSPAVRGVDPTMRTAVTPTLALAVAAELVACRPHPRPASPNTIEPAPRVQPADAPDVRSPSPETTPTPETVAISETLDPPEPPDPPEDSETTEVPPPEDVDPTDDSAIPGPAEVEVTEVDGFILRVHVRWGDEQQSIDISAPFEGCDYVSADSSPIKDRPELTMVQLLCTTGEDFMTLESHTSLVFTGERGHAQVLWSGRGTSSNEVGCIEYDVIFFKPRADGTVAVMRESAAYNGGADGSCPKRKRKERRIRRLTVP